MTTGSAGAHAGSNAGDALRKGVGLVHGAGEAIRGNINAAVDSAAGEREGVTKNESIASRGIDEIEHGHHHDRCLRAHTIYSYTYQSSLLPSLPPYFSFASRRTLCFRM
ncbi:hypothetical protein K491DRAFT_478787 [Lophiostoma macrostomum CBS 122681]|uniref:Uncharacterized protein n=1 Tax=Lophiostoma macrostomum CBS 122681 TaxID=1314788 RepID=A0A6A6TM51_9PLEO|nr:hypothetical protein K491DRAFT_478787 [Lophiostoma macrostomum CBS 122681]